MTTLEETARHLAAPGKTERPQSWTPAAAGVLFAQGSQNAGSMQRLAASHTAAATAATATAARPTARAPSQAQLALLCCVATRCMLT